MSNNAIKIRATDINIYCTSQSAHIYIIYQQSVHILPQISALTYVQIPVSESIMYRNFDMHVS